MRIAVFGATGMIGSAIAEEADRRGHEVLAIARHEADSRTSPPQGNAIERQVGDAADAAFVAGIAADNDAMVAAFGPSRAPGDDKSAYVGLLGTFVEAAGATPVLGVGGAGSLLLPDGTRLIDSPDFPEEYKAEGLVGAEALDMLREAPDGVEWTYLSPAPQIAPGTRTGTYTTSVDTPAGDSISAEDYAIAAVDELEKPAHRRARFTVAD